MFSYDYMSEDKLSANAGSYLLTPGPAHFVIRGFVDTNQDGTPLISRASKAPMIKLDLSVTDARGKTASIYEYLTANNPWRIKQLAEAVGRPSLYSPSGTLNPRELLNLDGQCVVKTFSQEGFGDKTKVDKFVPSNRPQGHQEYQAPKSVEDDLPF